MRRLKEWSDFLKFVTQLGFGPSTWILSEERFETKPRNLYKHHLRANKSTLTSNQFRFYTYSNEVSRFRRRSVIRDTTPFDCLKTMANFRQRQPLPITLTRKTASQRFMMHMTSAGRVSVKLAILIGSSCMLGAWVISSSRHLVIVLGTTFQMKS